MSMHDDDPAGVSPSLYAQPLGDPDRKGIIREHPFLAILAVAVLGRFAFEVTRLSRACLLRTAGEDGLRAYRRRQSRRRIAIAVLGVTGIAAAPFSNAVCALALLGAFITGCFTVFSCCLNASCELKYRQRNG